MKEIQWKVDETTHYWAKRIALPATLWKAAQFSGEDNKMYKETWQQRIIVDDFPDFCYNAEKAHLVPSIKNIKQCFQNNYFLEGLVLTIGWGGMARTQKHIYDQWPNLEKIQTVLAVCKETIGESGDVEAAWKLLTGKSSDQLGWGRVITSKVLHFLTRSYDYELPPVPYDNAVLRYQVEPWFFTSIKLQRQQRDPSVPKGWWDDEDSWDGYNRYMTAIVCWAKQRGWETTDVDASLFAKLLSGEASTLGNIETNHGD